jgi:hypothetical protein
VSCVKERDHPGGVATAQAVDTNYVAGLVWDRYPQIRFTYRINKTNWFAFSVENPEQQVGSRLVIYGFASDRVGRFIGGLMPDVIFKANGSNLPIQSYSRVSGLEFLLPWIACGSALMSPVACAL